MKGEGKTFGYWFSFDSKNEARWWRGNGIFCAKILFKDIKNNEEIQKSIRRIYMNATKNFLVLLENKRLYFNVNGDKIDITDKVFNNLSNIGEYMDE